MTETTAKVTWQIRVRALRLALNISRQEMARRLRCSIATVIAWERGWWPPNEQHQKRILRLEKTLGPRSDA